MLKIIFLILMSSLSFAATEFEVGAYSNFVWRGTTFTENKPAIQAEVDAENKHGFYVGGFVSNAEFNDPVLDENAQVTQEIDYLIGKRWSGEHWQVQLSYGHFTFPNAEVFNSDELNLIMQYKNYSLELSYMDDYFGYQTIQHYVRLGYEWNYNESLTGGLFAGLNTFSNPRGSIMERNGEQGLTGAGNPDYIDVFFVNRKTLENNWAIEFALNWTNRKEYSVEADDITKDDAKDFAAIVAFIIPFNL